MPLYEYQCDNCGHRFEVIRKFSDPPLETCPKCGGHVQKLIASPAFQFKGSGWYITDYAKKDSAGSKDGKEDGKEKNAKDKNAKDKDAAPAAENKNATSKSDTTTTTDTSSSPAKNPAKD